MITHSSRCFWLRMFCGGILLSFLAWTFCNSELLGQTKEKQKGKSEPTVGEDKGEQKDVDVPKAPPDDFMVEVYKALDEKKLEKLSIKDKFKHYKEDLDVEISLTYFNWSLKPDDYYNRQIHVDTKMKDGYVIETFVKNGFGEFANVVPGETATKDVYRKEIITESGGQSVATMCECPVAATEKRRFQALVQKIVLKK
jgi:hypothetical protein